MTYGDSRNPNEMYAHEKNLSQGAPVDRAANYINPNLGIKGGRVGASNAIQANATFHGGIGKHE